MQNVNSPHSNSLKKNKCKSCPKSIYFAFEWLIKVAICYGTIMFLGAGFVFICNIGIEAVLFVFDRLFFGTKWFGAIFVFFPQFIIILVICWKLWAQCWKIALLVFWNKWDNQLIACCCRRMSYAMLARIILILVINYWAVHQLFMDSISTQNVQLLDDQSLFQNLTKASMFISAILCILFVSTRMIWNHLIIFQCLDDWQQTLKFIMLRNEFKLNDWIQANNKWKCWLTQSVCNEMSKYYQHKKTRDAVNKIQSEQRKCILKSNDIEHHRKSNDYQSENSNISNKASYTQYLLRCSCLIWYFMQIIYVLFNMKDVSTSMKISCFLFPIVLYWQLLTDQCQIKLFDYLTEYNSYQSFRGPVIIKSLLVIWGIMACVFSAQLIIFSQIDIYGKQTKSMESEQSNNDKNPIYNFFHNADDAKMSEFTYPFCQIEEQKEEMLTVLFFNGIVYMKDEANIKTAMKLYFGDDSEWQLKHSQLNTVPAFMHVHNKATGQDLIVCRGTLEIKDYYEDFTLYSEILALQGFSKLIPITSLWPESLLQEFIKFMSTTEGIVFPNIEKRHSKEIMEYVESSGNVKIPRQEDKESKPLIISGHSLGGATAHIVAAKLKKKNKLFKMKSFGISNPGLVWSSKKFEIEPHLLSEIAVSVQPRSDPIPLFDEHVGTIHKIDCQSPYQEGCHYVEQSFCEIYTSCTVKADHNVADERKRDFVKCVCDNRKYMETCVKRANAQK